MDKQKIALITVFSVAVIFLIGVEVYSVVRKEPEGPASIVTPPTPIQEEEEVVRPNEDKYSDVIPEGSYPGVISGVILKSEGILYDRSLTLPSRRGMMDEVIPEDASAIELADTDLHLYCDDGRHIGVNYETGRYENDIYGSIVSGDNFNAPEWILVPDIEERGCYYAVSAFDNGVFFASNEEARLEIKDPKDSFDIYAQYIIPGVGIYRSKELKDQMIDPGEELSYESVIVDNALTIRKIEK